MLCVCVTLDRLVPLISLNVPDAAPRDQEMR